MPAPLEIFGGNVRELRRRKGLSQERLAELSGLHRTYIGGIERGERNIGLMNILYLAKALETSPCKLFSDLENLSPGDLPER